MGLSGTLTETVFVYLYLCISTSDTWNIVYEVLMSGLSATLTKAVFVYLCIWTPHLDQFFRLITLIKCLNKSLWMLCDAPETPTE